ncbi:hypothetical protein BDZ45DRAFT_255781 [Acephala macrosclerotiorum]|nr:hypothetical protein BDZ45DRAFT_255781 [Acephala macrosclerotiorum]
MKEAGALESPHCLGVYQLPEIVDEETVHAVSRDAASSWRPLHRGRPLYACCLDWHIWCRVAGGVKQIMEEATNILYGENKFVFDTRGNYPFPHHSFVHAHDVFSKDRQLVPGLPYLDGRPVSQRQIQTSLDKMFRKDKYQPLFVVRDPLVKFFNHIGSHNASKIRKIQIEGFFKSAKNNDRYKFERPIGLAQILPIHNTILRNVCLDLQQLTIIQGGNDDLWSDDLENNLI